MEKYLNITGVATAGYAGSQLVSLIGIKTIRAATATAVTTVIQYVDGTATTINHDAQVGFDVQLALEAAVQAALETSWTKPIFDVALPRAITAAGIVNA